MLGSRVRAPGGALKTPLQVSVEGFICINVPKMFLFLAQRKIPVVLHFLHHRHKACIASGSPLAQLAQLALRRWLAYLPAPVPCTMQKIFSSRKKWSYDQNIRLFFDPDSVNHAKSHIFDSFREFQSKNRRVF